MLEPPLTTNDSVSNHLTYHKLTISHLSIRPVIAPLARPVHTASGSVETAPLVLIDLHTKEGITGRSYLFCFTNTPVLAVAQLLRDMETLIKGDTLAPVAIEDKLQGHFRLVGPQGFTGMAIAGIDMAAWDALAKAANMPLVNFLGGKARPLAAYSSYGMMDKATAIEAAEEVVSAGFKAMKIKIGYPTLAADLETIHAVRSVTGKDVKLMVDYNQALSPAEAIERITQLEAEDLCWIEEPVLAHDYEGCAKVTRAVNTPINIGENWWGIPDMSKSIAANASNYAMIDIMKIGGVTGWLRASALADAANIPLSSHLFQEVSLHLMAVSRTCHWVEYIDLASAILQEPIEVKNGDCLIPEKPGCGMEWDESAVKQYLVE